MKTTLSLVGAGVAILLACPMIAHANNFNSYSTASPSEILLASNTRPAFRHQQRFRYRHAMRQRHQRRYRQHPYRRHRC
jgi:hypothetical protein